MALRGRRISNFLELWCLLASGGLKIWVSWISFQKSNIIWPQKINKIIDISSPQSWFTLHTSIWDTLYIFQPQKRIVFVETIRGITVCTLYNAILRIARNFLETRENIKISTHPFYHVNLDWFSWEWSKKILFFFEKKIQNGRFSKMAIFQNRQFSKFFHENFTDSSLG